ncbi:hypothetical protein [Bermanella sp. R86510]|uniref:hypothetical protein n=1 Tax=unclassified Bermanella TaxID=2627862 RepID=UPI0037CA1A8E
MIQNILKSTLILLSLSFLAACGGEEEKNENRSLGKDNNPEVDNQKPEVDDKDSEEEDNKPIIDYENSLVIDATHAYYFASKDLDGNWDEMDQKEHEVENGPLHIVYICENQNGSFSVIAENTSYEKDDGYLYKLCNESNNNELGFDISAFNDDITLKSIGNQQYSYSSDSFTQEFTEDDNTTITAIGYQASTEQAYVYKRDVSKYSEQSIIIDFMDNNYAQKVSHIIVPDPEAENYQLTYSTPHFSSLLNFSHNGQHIAAQIPDSWEGNKGKYIETWSDRYRKVSQEPSYSKDGIELGRHYFLKNGLELDLNTRTASIGAMKKLDGFVGAFYSLEYFDTPNGVNFYFYADELDGKVIFDLIDFTSLPNFPNDKITNFPYLQPDFDKWLFNLTSEHVNEWWLEYDEIGRKSIVFEAVRLR